MTLGVRKLVVVAFIAAVVLVANAFALVRWLAESGVIDFARYLLSEYLTGTAVAVILVLLFVTVPPACGWRIRRCTVCDHLLLRTGNYCPSCGSRV